jgi:NTP pyrophosphatase (non-canonical NTP hydrolase)
MKLNEYQEQAMKTQSDIYRDLVSASTMGLVREAGEVLELIHKSIHHNKPLDTHKVAEELGDVLWNIACLAKFFDFSLEDIAKQNIEKLRERHGDKYNASHYEGDTLVDEPPVEE